MVGISSRRNSNNLLLDLVDLIVMLDLSAAFYTTDHIILSKRLEGSFGVKGTALKWFASYLKNRTQFVKVSGF